VCESSSRPPCKRTLTSQHSKRTLTTAKSQRALTWNSLKKIKTRCRVV
jgi:hypothetical protein